MKNLTENTVEPWDSYDGWMYHMFDRVVLTPQNQLVILPYGFEPYRGFPDWLLVTHYTDTGAIDWWLVGPRGEMCKLDLSKYNPGGWWGSSPEIYPGKRCMLIFHRDDKGQALFSLARIDPATSVVQPSCPYSQIVIASDFVMRVDCVVAKDGTTDVFIALVRMMDWAYRLYVVNERGQFWHPPVLFHHVSLYRYTFVYGAQKSNATVIVPDTPIPLVAKANQLPVWVLSGRAHIQLERGITLSGQLVFPPRRKSGL